MGQLAVIRRVISFSKRHLYQAMNLVHSQFILSRISYFQVCFHISSKHMQCQMQVYSVSVLGPVWYDNLKNVHIGQRTTYSVFSPFWGENILVGPRREYLDSTIYFPFSLPNQSHSKKVFLPIFSPKFSLHLVSPLNKHTLNFYFSLVTFLR